MLPAQVPNIRVKAVIHNRHNTRRVTQERPTARDRIQGRVQPQLRRLARAPSQALLHAPRAAYRQRRQVCVAGAVAEVVGEAARGEHRLPAGQVGQRRVLEGDVLERAFVEAREGVEGGRVGEGGAVEEGAYAFCGGGVEGGRGEVGGGLGCWWWRIAVLL